jgi:hypothetical protein
VEAVGPLIMHQIVRGLDLVRDEDHFVIHFTGERRSATAPDPGADGWRWWTLHEFESRLSSSNLPTSSACRATP